MTTSELVNKFLFEQPMGAKFGMRDICQYIYLHTMGRNNPLDSTVGRMMRSWRADETNGYDIICVDHKKALYQKVKRTYNEDA